MQTPTIRRRPRKSQRRRDGLLRFAKDNTSQNGEDGIINRIFHCLPPPPQERQQNYICVDVGAWDGAHLSNTYSLLTPDPSPWQGVLIEADKERYNDLCTLYVKTKNVCINAAVSCHQDSAYSLVSLLANHATHLNISDCIDFLCIDIDGGDYWVLHGLLSSGLHRPRVICIEFNPTMPDDLVYIPARIDTVRHGASISALVELTEKHNYTLVETTLYNAFFVEKPLYEAFLKPEVPDTSIEALYEPTMTTSLYQLYDGTLKLWGCKRMLWHRLPVGISCGAHNRIAVLT